MMQCLECGMREREEHMMAEKHVCNRITDPDYPAEALKGQTIRVGKRRFVKFV